jgi:hypothetical protein
MGRLMLDRALANGADPSGDRALALRAEQLVSERCRRGLARSLDDVLDAAEEPPSDVPDLQLRVARGEVLEARPEVLALARRLRYATPVTARGVAMVRQLLVNPNSALYVPRGAGSVRESARAATEALDDAPR